MTIYHNITEDYPVFNMITALWLFVLISLQNKYYAGHKFISRNNDRIIFFELPVIILPSLNHL